MNKRLLSILAIAMMIATTINAQIPTNGLIAYYPFTGNAIDSSGNGNNGTVNGATLTTDRFGKANNAYNFNGTSDYIQVANSASLNSVSNQITISMWLNYDNLLSDYNWKGISKGGWNVGSGYELLYRNSYNGDSGGVQLTSSYSGYDASYFNLDTLQGKWINLISTYSQSQGKLYCNGKLIPGSASGGGFSNFISNTYDLLIGKRNPNDQFAGYVNGKLDDIRIYNRALDSSEVQALYNEGGYALPVTFENINASKNGNWVSIDWRTAEEVNTNNFNIQHSNNGVNFTDIGSVKAIGISENSYEFTHKIPTSGVNYYRIESVDKDGSSTFSKVVSVNFGEKQSFSIIPNPARDFATINFSKAVDKATIAVYDITGKQVIKQSLSATNSYKINTQSLKSGLYVIKVNTATSSYNEKLLISK